jgi:pyrimidine operon attenuation protein/uracil phosphoribosyltransferase
MTDIIFDTGTVNEALDRLAQAMMQGEVVNLIGIQRGGAEVANALQERLEQGGVTVQRGNLDISFYRDDLDTIGANPEVRTSHLPFDLTDQKIWLVDDVLYTGRTIRAALGELFDYARPSGVQLAVLLDRGGRELPIAANATGLMYDTDSNFSVKLITDDGGWYIELGPVNTNSDRSAAPQGG